MRRHMILLILALVVGTFATAADKYESDNIPVQGGNVQITFYGHASLMFQYDGKVIQIDPVSRYADYSQQPDADIILITHEHSDHFDPMSIQQIRTPDTVVVHNPGTATRIDGGIVLENGESTTVGGILIEAIPAYNTTKGREQFHPKGRDNGYILTLGGKRFYVAGDTEDTDEMLALKDIYVAFLPVNQPYTMVPDQAIRAAKAFRPKILYPYHYGNTDVQKIVAGISSEPGIEVRIRNLQ